MEWLVALAVILLLGCIPVGVYMHYDASGFFLQIVASFFRYTVIPFPKKKKAPKGAKKRTGDTAVETAAPSQLTKQAVTAAESAAPSELTKQAATAAESAAPSELTKQAATVAETAAPSKSAKQAVPAKPVQKTTSTGGSVVDFLPLVRIGLDFLNAFRRKLRVNHLMCRVILAGDDPCDVGINYGRAWEAVGSLLPLLERSLVIKKRDIEVECDFTSTQTRILFTMELTITIGRVLLLGIVYGTRCLIEFLKIKKKRKGGVPA